MAVGLHGPWRWVISANIDGHDACLTEPEELELDYMERKSVEYADIVYTPSSYLQEFLANQSWVFPSETYMLPYLPGSEVKSVAKNFEQPISKELKEIVFFGRLEARKGITLFCDAMDLLAQQLPNIKVSFLGRSVEDLEGLSSQQYIYQRAISGRWPFDWQIVSDKDRKAALEYLKRDGVLAVIPSIIDNAPYTVYECLYTQIPFIASNTPSIVPLISPESQDALFELTSEDLVKKVLEVYWNGLKSVKVNQAGVISLLPREISKLKKWKRVGKTSMCT